jgi:hypothetical protein
MTDLLLNLAISVPSAVAVIITVLVFLRHMTEDRRSRDAAQQRFLNTMEKLSVPIQELTIEVRLLRESEARKT